MPSAMIENLPTSIVILFVATVVLTLGMFHWVLRNHSSRSRQTNRIMIGLVLWIVLQSILGLTGFYTADPRAMPPRFLLTAVPALLVIVALFISARGRAFIDGMPLLQMTYLNVVRIPVEITLFLLCVHAAVPEVMTFEGRNFDILAGITAPIVAFFGLQQGKRRRTMLLVWNVLSLLLLLNIVVHAVLSLPSAFQQIAFEQPNHAVLNWPFNLLPAFVVPVVLLGHIASIRQLRKAVV